MRSEEGSEGWLGHSPAGKQSNWEGFDFSSEWDGKTREDLESGWYLT